LVSFSVTCSAPAPGLRPASRFSTVTSKAITFSERDSQRKDEKTAGVEMTE
jgi:hypothetical protein